MQNPEIGMGWPLPVLLITKGLSWNTNSIHSAFFFIETQRKYTSDLELTLKFFRDMTDAIYTRFVCCGIAEEECAHKYGDDRQVQLGEVGQVPVRRNCVGPSRKQNLPGCQIQFWIWQFCPIPYLKWGHNSDSSCRSHNNFMMPIAAFKSESCSYMYLLAPNLCIAGWQFHILWPQERDVKWNSDNL